jgi:small nuclear ribonucleoprotein (snRNP)-like protein
MEYHGRLNAVDSYMNIKLTNTEEWKDGKNEGTLGEVFIRCVILLMGQAHCVRCNNVLWISENLPYTSDRMQQD